MDYAKAKKNTLKFGAGIHEAHDFDCGDGTTRRSKTDETFAVTLSDAVNATIVDGEGVGTIEDNDAVQPPPTVPTLDIGDVTIAEADERAEFTVTLSETSTEDVTVMFATSDGTALSRTGLHGQEQHADDCRGKHVGDDFGAGAGRRVCRRGTRRSP